MKGKDAEGHLSLHSSEEGRWKGGDRGWGDGLSGPLDEEVEDRDKDWVGASEYVDGVGWKPCIV